MGYGEMFLAGVGLWFESGGGNSINQRQWGHFAEAGRETVNDKSHRLLNYN